MQHNCLNCNQAITTNFCGNCGQKSSTHRYSLKHFIEHDFIHGVWHIDKGILYTIKALFTRPGHSVREYVLGKRAGYFNFITLLLLLVALAGVIAHYSQLNIADLMPEASKKTMTSLQRFTTNYPRIFLLITIPIYALFSYCWFSKAKFNYSEHLVLNSYKTAAELIIGICFTIITIFYTNVSVLTIIYFAGINLITIAYTVWLYHQFFSQSGYSKKSLLFRSIMVPVSYLIVSFVVGIVWAIFARLGH
ncbi:DUF3667 domain-containing protein [Pedobacter rhizosphaerae]|uniref:DUF3667 domain-containing protein n=1 Tax=Pedobacter rhizosphaerae TaxID=390241 RepID=A0A1H9W8T6_9SPHI|nr:DUF3667 domain-containing protein [Pedobacter rhizosphaerae]SES29873.1 Protein of unknown function [Pedobacter rhizosphaerae]